MTALLDTGFLLAVLDASDEHHEACKANLLAEHQPLLPDVVLPELAYMTLRELGYPVWIQFLKSVVAEELPLERIRSEDLARSAEILEQYADAKVDFVDCVIVAMAERLNVVRIMTVDQRHFRMFQPKHCKSFTILP